jgi:starch-binding outer membrane protein SusE/F
MGHYRRWCRRLGDDDVAMEYEIVDKVWRAAISLSAGEIKFRANASWNLNYGDNDGEGTRQRDGANIVVEEAGNYTVELDLSEPTYSYRLNQN